MAAITGTNSKNTLVGTNSKDIIVALDDDDIAAGLGGNDSIDGGNDLDSLFGGTGNDTILGGSGADLIHGGAGNDLIGLSDNSRNASPGGGAGDVIYGDGFNNFILVSGNVVGQDPTAPTQRGDDVIYGTAETDTIYGDSGDNLDGSGGEGHDTIFAGSGSDTVYGEAGNDSISGEGGNDLLVGGDGKDTLSGGEGNDTLMGGSGADVIDGGSGDDRIVYNGVSDSSGNKNDTINAFVSGLNYASGDKIDITGFLPSGAEIHWLGAPPAAPIPHTAWYQPVAGGVKLMVDSSGDGVADLQVVLQGIGSLKHSDILGVMNADLVILSDSTPQPDGAVEAGRNTPGDPNASGVLLVNGTGLDLEGDVLQVANAGVQQGTYGSIVVALDGSWTYTLNDLEADTDALNAGQSATDHFSLLFTDGLAISNPVNLVIAVIGANDAPALIGGPNSALPIVEVSTDAAGGPADHVSGSATFSPDSEKVLFHSVATNLVAGDTNSGTDVFLKDLDSGSITRVSTDAGGGQANGSSSGAVFSPDGAKIAFRSDASNLVAGDTNGKPDIFVKDLGTGVVTRVSTSAAGGEADLLAAYVIGFPTSGTVAFYSHATNLVPGDTNGLPDIFIKDLATGAITRVNNGGGGQVTYLVETPVFSADGSKIAFQSASANVVPGDTNGVPDIFVKDLITGSITRVSTDSGGAQANHLSETPVFSPDGSKVAFSSVASNLVAGDTIATDDIFIKDLVTGAIVRVSTNESGVAANGSSFDPAFSPDGGRIAFYSYANNLVPGDTNNRPDVFVKDLATGAIVRVNTSEFGVQADSLSLSTNPVFSPDGLRIVFESSAENLAPSGYPIGLTDIFVKELTGVPVLALPTIAEDSTSPGTSVGALIGAVVHDPDAGAVAGAAIVAADAANGSWQYSLDNGGNWLALGAVSNSYARLLAPDALIRFVPFADWNGQATMQLRAWDQTSGSNGQVADTTSNGGSTAFSGEVSVAQVTVTPANDPPFVVNATTDAITEDESDPLLTASGTITFDDLEVGDAHTVFPTKTSGSLGGFLTASLIDPATGPELGTISWSYLTSNFNTQYLAEGETATESFLVSIFDDHGGVGVQAVDVNVIGANDAPVLGHIRVGAPIVRVSTDAFGGQGDSSSLGPVFSPDGTKIAFFGSASNLVAGDTNGVYDIFVKDLASGQVVRASTDASGAEANDFSRTPVFSPDGSKVAFASAASNLVPGDTNLGFDIFVKDLASGAIVRASTDSSGNQQSGVSFRAMFSPDGTKLIFESTASNLTAGDTNLHSDVFIKDLASGAITRVSTDSSGAQANGLSFGGAFSPDGSKVAFVSAASNLVSGDSNGVQDIFLKDLSTGQVTLVSVNAFGIPSDADLDNFVFSHDGTKIAFASDATDLVASDTNAALDVFVKDLVTGLVILVSTDAAGNQANGASFNPAFSPDDQQVMFGSFAANLVQGDQNSELDIFVKNLATGEVVRVSTGAGGDEANSFSLNAVFTPNGEQVAFHSLASNLVDGDSNQADDIFVKDLAFGGPVVTEDAETFVGGNMGFADADLADAHTVEATPAAGGYIGTFLASVDDDSTGDGMGSVGWSFSVDNGSLQFLESGETLVQTYTITVDDGLAAASKDVTITIHGEDEPPIQGDGDANELAGNAGDDLILGEGGNDILVGGAGDDTLTGGSGDDEFRWNGGDQGSPGAPTEDTVTDFLDSGDLLNLSDLLVGESVGNLDSYLDFGLAAGATTVSVRTSGSGGADQLIVLNGVDLVSGTSGDNEIISNLLTAGRLITD
jgi:VCBS repeat-containing protein